MMHFIEAKAKPHAFVLRNLHLIYFFLMTWVASWAPVAKIRLNKASQSILRSSGVRKTQS